LPLLGLSLLL